jgi:hypothetical protein
LRVPNSILPSEGSRGCQLSLFRVVKKSEEKTEEDGRGEKSAGKCVGNGYADSIACGLGGVPAVHFIYVKSEKKTGRR